jgi:hypothetical protein
MKTTVFLLLAVCHFSRADEGSQHKQIEQAKRPGQKQQAIVESIKEEADVRIKDAIDPYREHDSKTYFVGKYVYSRQGIISKLPNDDVRLWYRFKVLEVSKEGCKIGPPADVKRLYADLEIFIAGLKGLESGREYTNTLMIFSTEKRYEYRTSSGDSRSIPLYEWGTPITEEEYSKRVLSPTIKKVSEQ